MAGLFDGAALRTQFARATQSQINGATTLATAFYLINFRKELKLCLFSNNSSVSVDFYMVAPNTDPTVLANRQFAFSIGPNEALNLDVFGLTLDAGTTVYIVAESAGALAGEQVRCFAWG